MLLPIAKLTKIKTIEEILVYLKGQSRGIFVPSPFTIEL